MIRFALAVIAVAGLGLGVGTALAAAPDTIPMSFTMSSATCPNLPSRHDAHGLGHRDVDHDDSRPTQRRHHADEHDARPRHGDRPGGQRLRLQLRNHFRISDTADGPGVLGRHGATLLARGERAGPAEQRLPADVTIDFSGGCQLRGGQHAREIRSTSRPDIASAIRCRHDRRRGARVPAMGTAGTTAVRRAVGPSARRRRSCGRGCALARPRDRPGRARSLDAALATQLRQRGLHGPDRVDADRAARPSARPAAGGHGPDAVVRHDHRPERRQRLRRLPFADQRLRRHAVDRDRHRLERDRRAGPQRARATSAGRRWCSTPPSSRA